MEENENKTTPLNPMKYVWVIVAVILVAAAWFGIKTLLASMAEYKVTLVDAPKELEEGSVATFTWRIDGPPTTINQTVVYYGTVSNPGDLGKDVKPADTQYTDFVKDFVSGEYAVPLQFIGNAPIATQGKYYYRVYAPVKNKNYWSDEYSFEVVPAVNRISIMSAPTLVALDAVTSFTWRVTGPQGSVNQTAIHFGTESTPGILGPEVKPEDTVYTNMTTEFTKGNYAIPLQFVANAQMATPGAYFYRAHTIVNGQNLWTDEGTFEVK